MTSEASARDCEENTSSITIIDSEIAEEAEDAEQRTEVPEESVASNGSISEQVANESKSQPQRLITPDNHSDNYSEEFENEEEADEEDVEESVNVVEQIVGEEEEDDGAGSANSSSVINCASAAKSSRSSSGSIRIRCEINISNSAVKSPVPADGGEEDVEDVDRTSAENSITCGSGESTSNNAKKRLFTMEDEVQSWTPSDYNEESHLFEMGILHESMVNLFLMQHGGHDRKLPRERQQPRMKYKNGTRMSLSFTNERVREIERHNQILVRKIFQQSASPQATVSITLSALS